ncbi:MAG: HmuY family protein [Bacteroidetes bacterium]|nr:HmuY family protein [Bacteroidota bacterium]
MLQRRFMIPLVALFCVLISSCKEDEIVEPTGDVSQAAVVMLKDIPADSSGTSGQFTYVRLRDSLLVSLSDSNTTGWDIAFRSTTIRINAGLSGPGQGGALVLHNCDFDTLSRVPATGYAVDSTARPATLGLAVPTGSGKGWYNYNPSTNIIAPIPGVVLALRTADGKFAKVQILNYYRGAPAVPSATDSPRYFTIRYVYQADGSTDVQ